MKKKSLFCTYCSNPLEDDGTCKMCPKGNTRNSKNIPQADLFCTFNDHGTTCGKRGSMSDSTVGGGPWYCSEHFWILHKREPKQEPPILNYREQWYADNKLSYEPPRKLDERLSEWTAMHGHAPKRERQPGEDEDYKP